MRRYNCRKARREGQVTAGARYCKKQGHLQINYAGKCSFSVIDNFTISKHERKASSCIEKRTTWAIKKVCHCASIIRYPNYLRCKTIMRESSFMIGMQHLSRGHLQNQLPVGQKWLCGFSHPVKGLCARAQAVYECTREVGGLQMCARDT